MRKHRTLRPNNAMRAFTLLEVLAALAIAAGALTYLLVTEAEGARRVSRTRNIRTAAMLAEQKIAEIAAGIEKETNGSFEGTAFSWSATRESFAQAPGCSKVTLTVSGGGQEVALEEVVE